MALMVMVNEVQGFMGTVPGVRVIAKNGAAPWESDRITSRRRCPPIAMSSTVPPQRERQENLSVGDFDRLGISMIKILVSFVVSKTLLFDDGGKGGSLSFTFWELMDNVYLGRPWFSFLLFLEAHAHCTCSGCEKRGVHVNWSMGLPKLEAPVYGYLGNYWPRAGELSVVNAIVIAVG